MDKENYFLIEERFKLFGKIVFLQEGSHAAEFALVIDEILNNLPDENVDETRRNNLLELKERFNNMFKTYHQDYIDNPDAKERVFRYRRNLKQFAGLAVELENQLEVFGELKPENSKLDFNLIDATKKNIEGILNKSCRLESEFPETDDN